MHSICNTAGEQRSVPGPVFSKKIISYVRIFVNMVDSYLAAKNCKFVFSKALRIFAAMPMNFVSYVRKSREVLFALQWARSLFFYVLLLPF